jgi:ABC-type nitrate/sulfonate/bicarbonate transport system substrate-binding protein
VRKDSGIDKIEDMKGKVAATNGLGSGVDIAMRSALAKHGLQGQRDYTMIEAPFPAHKAILKEKKADLVVGVLPFSYDPEFNEFAKPLFTTQVGHRQHRAVVLGGAQGLHRQEPRRAGRSDGGLLARSCAGTTTGATTRRRWR